MTRNLQFYLKNEELPTCRQVTTVIYVSEKELKHGGCDYAYFCHTLAIVDLTFRH